MSDPHLNEPLSVEKEVLSLVDDARQCLRDGYESCEKHVRESPATSMVSAVLAGYILHRLPLRSIMVAKVRIIASLLPPVVFVLGAAKVLELVQRSARSRETPTS